MFRTVNKLNNKSPSAVNQVFDNYSNNSDIGAKEFARKIARLKNNYTQPILSSVSSLPKKELANMAESLIHITSIKRKVDSNLETVGGHIDVSIISKGDGYIWKRKKHYFDLELNPQFFIK